MAAAEYLHSITLRHTHTYVVSWHVSCAELRLYTVFILEYKWKWTHKHTPTSFVVRSLSLSLLVSCISRNAWFAYHSAQPKFGKASHTENACLALYATYVMSGFSAKAQRSRTHTNTTSRIIVTIACAPRISAAFLQSAPTMLGFSCFPAFVPFCSIRSWSSIGLSHTFPNQSEPCVKPDPMRPTPTHNSPSSVLICIHVGHDERTFQALQLRGIIFPQHPLNQHQWFVRTI